MYLEIFLLVLYFAMIISMLFAVNNVEFIANHPRTAQIVDKIRYNLRDIPRVDYTEVSSEEEYYEDIDSEEENAAAAAAAEPAEGEKEQEVRHRRERGAFGRILDEALN